jgi:hypothetical protein
MKLRELLIVKNLHLPFFEILGRPSIPEITRFLLKSSEKLALEIMNLMGQSHKKVFKFLTLDGSFSLN